MDQFEIPSDANFNILLKRTTALKKEDLNVDYDG